MLRLDKVIKPWKESAALNDHINLYGFWNETAFLTKSGDLGMILSVPGVDYESLDRSEQEYSVKRLEAALKAFGPGFHVYQYLFKSNRPDIPFATYDDPIVQAAIDQRRKFFEAKWDHLYQVEIFYCILLEGARSKTGVGTALARLLRDPEGAIAELKSQFTNDSMKKLLRTHIEGDLQRLDQHVQAFARQLADFMQIEVLNRQGQFTFFRRLLNYDDWRVAGKPQSSQFLDYQVVNSDIEAERDHLRVGEHIVRVLTMKEAITETKPLVLDALLKIPANFYVVTEWTPLPADKARKEVNKRRRHFNMSKTEFVSQMGNDATKTNPRDVLVDESKQADIENLGDCLRALGDGQSLGDFSLTIVLFARSRADIDQLVAEFTGVFTNADGNLFAETYNQLNAYFATVPGNYSMNLRQLYLLNTNYADLSFLFTILPGERTNAHLGTEYLAVVETDNSTPYFLNLHTRDVAHTLILGMTGSGKTATLREIDRGLRDAGREVLAVAPTRSAVDELEKVGFRDAMTVSRLLEGQEPQGRLRGRVLIVDEAGMVSGRQMQSLLHLAEDQGARIVFSGDTRQIPSVEASDALRILERESALKSISLTEVQRQTNSAYREAVKTMRHSPEEGFAQLEKLGAIREVSIFDRGQIVAELHREFRAEGRDTLVVAGTHAEISQLTNAIRQDRKYGGELGVSQSLDQYVSLQWTTAQKQELSNYQEGQILQFHRDTKLAKRHESLEVVSVGPESLVARKETGEEVSISPKQTRAFSVYERQPIEIATGDSLMLTANRRGAEFKATNGELVKVKSLNAGAIHLEDGRTLPANYHEYTHGYAVTAHRSQGKTVDTVIISADAMKKELFYVAASRGRSEIAVVTSDREQLRESVGVSTMRQSAIELARKQMSAHSVTKSESVDLVTGVNRPAGQQIGEQHSSVPNTPEPEKTPHVGVEHDLGGPGLGLGL